MRNHLICLDASLEKQNDDAILLANLCCYSILKDLSKNCYDLLEVTKEVRVQTAVLKTQSSLRPHFLRLIVSEFLLEARMTSFFSILPLQEINYRAYPPRKKKAPSPPPLAVLFPAS